MRTDGRHGTLGRGVRATRFVLIAALPALSGFTLPTWGQDASNGPLRPLLGRDVLIRIRDEMREPAAAQAWARFSSALPRIDPSGPWRHSQYQDLLACGFAATVDTTDKRAFELARCILELACIQTAWCQPGNEHRPIDLYAAETAAAVAIVYAWLHDRLTPRERSLVGPALDRLAFAPYLAAASAEQYPLGEYADNWCAVVSTGIGTAGAIMAGESELARSVGPIARGQIVGALDQLGKDGGWAEGLGYWGWVVESILRYGDVLNDLRMDAEDILGHEAFRGTTGFPVHLYLPPREYVDFGDSGNLGPSRTPLLRLAGLLRDGRLQWLAERKHANLRWLDILWWDDDISTTPPTGQPPAKLFGNINWAALRSGWDPDAVVLAMSGGARTAHSHLDANHILVHAFGETLLRDLGAKGYPEGYFSEGGKARYYWSDTRGHNAILMDGLGQRTELGTGSQITDFLNGPHCDYVCSDATRAYPDKASKVLRHVVFVRPGYFLIIDDLAAKWKTQWQWLGQSSGEFSLSPGQCTITCPNAALALRVLEPQGASAELLTHAAGEEYVSFSPSGTPEKTRFSVVLYPWKRSETEATPLRCPAEFRTDRNGNSTDVTVVREDGTVDELRWGESRQVADRLAIAVVSHDESEKIVGFSGFSTAKLGYAGQALLVSDRPLCVSADVKPDGLHLAAVSDTPLQDVRLWCPQEPVTILVDGVQGDWPYDQATSQLCGRLEAGTHEVLAQFALE